MQNTPLYMLDSGQILNINAIAYTVERDSRFFVVFQNGDEQEIEFADLDGLQQVANCRSITL